MPLGKFHIFFILLQIKKSRFVVKSSNLESFDSGIILSFLFSLSQAGVIY